MASGGKRAGAGRNPGGLSELTRVLRTAGLEALADLGEENGADGSREEQAVAAAKGILKDMVKAGRGDDVLKFLADISPKGHQAEGGGGSVLLMAMQSAPGLLPSDTGASLLGVTLEQEQSMARCASERAADLKSVARIEEPIFGRQLRLGVVEVEVEVGEK